MSNDDKLKRLDIQSLFTSAIIISSFLNLTIISLYKELIIDSSSKTKKLKEIEQLSKLSSNIFLIVNIYFFIDSYDVYKRQKTKANLNYYMASFLSLTAQSIRINTLYKYPFSATSSEDII